MDDPLELACAETTPPATLWHVSKLGGAAQIAVAENPAAPVGLLQWLVRHGDEGGRRAAREQLAARGAPEVPVVELPPAGDEAADAGFFETAAFGASRPAARTHQDPQVLDRRPGRSGWQRALRVTVGLAVLAAAATILIPLILQ